MKSVLLFTGLVFCCFVGMVAIATTAHSAPAGQGSGVQTEPLGGCVIGYTCAVTPGATIVPGTTDTGNHTDDGVTNVTLPFAVTLYGTFYTSVNVSSNGNAQFVSTNEEFNNVCLPVELMGPTIFAYWDDLVTEGTNCTGGCGIYTSITGSAPNRIFNIEWRTFYFSNPGNAYFEIRLYEGSPPRFDVIIGQINTGGTATIGVQDGAGRFTQCVCGTQAVPNSRIGFTATTGTCPTPTATPVGSTPTVTPTPPAGGVVHGHLTWQNVAEANRPSVTGTLALCVSGSPQTYAFTTDTNSTFTVTTGLSDGAYHWQVKGGRHISNASPDSGADLVISGGSGSHEFGTQRGGNTGADNIINTSDFTILKTTFGHPELRSADFNYDQLVNASDFNIMKTNFGQAGVELGCP